MVAGSPKLGTFRLSNTGLFRIFSVDRLISPVFVPARKQYAVSRKKPELADFTGVCGTPTVRPTVSRRAGEGRLTETGYLFLRICDQRPDSSVFTPGRM